MARRSPRASLLVALAMLPALSYVASAAADADPASDVLYTGTVFYSFDQLPSDAAQKQLNAVVAKATKAGYPIRVALIANPSDLGGITAFWGAPRKYARFLGLELGYYYKNSLLVVMPAGLGYSRHGKSPKSAYATLAPIRVGSGNDALADAAVRGIARLASAAGHPIAVPEKGSSGSSTTRDRLLILLAGLVLAQVVAAGYYLRRRGRPRS